MKALRATFKTVRGGLWLIRFWGALLFYKALPGVYFRRIGWGTRIYGRLRFGHLPSNIEIGRGCMLGAGLFLSAGDSASILIGNRVSINTGSHLVSGYGIEIGDGTLVGEYVSIRDQNHSFSDPGRPIRNQGFDGDRIRIGRDVWIGRGVFIGPGVEIGDGCVVGANSVVVKSLPAFAVAAGVPAQIIGWRSTGGTQR